MDKIGWNEQWLGWPVDESYSRASNVDNAWRLQGKLLLVVGELDQNVDPAHSLSVFFSFAGSSRQKDTVPVGPQGL